MNNRLMQALFSQPAPALGDAVLTAKSGISDINVRRTFIFFGDPQCGCACRSPRQRLGLILRLEK
jgi:hypothetical protein